VKSLLDCYNLPYSTVKINVRNVDEAPLDHHELNFRFWSALLPKLNEKTVLFATRNPTRDNWLTASSEFISRMRYRIVFNSNRCLIGFGFFTPDKEKNLRYFDLDYAQKDLIEDAFGEKLDWIRNENKVGSFVQCYAKNCRLNTESSWEKAIAFICEKMPKFHDALQPVLEQYRNLDAVNTTLDDVDEDERKEK